MYPTIYKRNEHNFEHNGEGILRDLIKCEVIEEDNGMFELEGECTVSSFLFDEIEKENVIRAWSSEELGEQLFRIYRVKKNIKGLITFNAQHISYDLLDNFIESIEVVDITCENALNEIFKHCAYPVPFKGHSDITHKGSIILQRVDPMKAIKGIRGSICDTYGRGPKLIKDNFNIKVMSNRGSNNNVLVAYKKNMLGFESDDPITDSLTTVIYPYAKINKSTGDSSSEEVINLPEKYIYSKYYEHYNNLKIKPVDLSGEDVTDVSSLRKKAETYFERTNCDVPNVNYKVEFLKLSDTVNYADYKDLESVQMGDTVIVRDYRFNLNISAKVIKTKHCSLTKKLLSCELGSFKYSMSDVINDINKDQSDIIDKVDKIKIDIDNEIGKIQVNIKDDIKGLQTQITANTEGIQTKVSNGEFESYKSQTANQIAQKVSAGDVNSIIQQNPGSVQIGFNGINDVIRMIPEGLRVNHGSSYSLLSGNGLRRYDGSSNKDYHYLTYVVGFTTTQDTNSIQWIQLPNEFKGKNFSAYATLSDTWEDSWDWGEPWVVQRMVVIAKEIDIANGRVGVQGYRIDKNYKTDTRRSRAIAGMLFVVA